MDEKAQQPNPGSSKSVRVFRREGLGHWQVKSDNQVRHLMAAKVMQNEQWKRQSQCDKLHNTDYNRLTSYFI